MQGSSATMCRRTVFQPGSKENTVFCNYRISGAKLQQDRLSDACQTDHTHCFPGSSAGRHIESQAECCQTANDFSLFRLNYNIQENAIIV